MFRTILVDRMKHCSTCGTPNPPTYKGGGLTLCCNVAACFGDPPVLLKTPDGKWICCEGIVARTASPDMPEVTPKRTKRKDIVPVRRITKELDVWSEPLELTSRPEVTTGSYEDLEEAPESPEAVQGETEDERRDRHRHIRNVRKKLLLGKISIEEAKERLERLGETL